MLKKKINNFLSLPELKFTNQSNQYKNTLRFYCKKTSDMEVLNEKKKIRVIARET